MTSKKRAFESDESMDSICHAVKRLHTSSSASISSEDASDAYVTADIGSSYVDVSNAQSSAPQSRPTEQQSAAVASNRSAPLRAVRPSAAALSPMSLRQAAQQQHWMRYQEINQQSEHNGNCYRAASVPRVSTQPSPAHQQLHHSQQLFDQQSSPQCNSAAGAVDMSSEAAEQRLLDPNAEDLAAYEQANHMLKRLHFELMKRRTEAPGNTFT